MKRTFRVWAAAVGFLAGLPVGGGAQLVVDVGLRWESPTPRWSTVREDRRGLMALRVPRGHLPRPGFCKVWHPGRAPGHQPPASKCERLVVRHRTFGAGTFADALLLVGPDRRIPIDSRDVRFVPDGRDDRGKHRGRR